MSDKHRYPLSIGKDDHESLDQIAKEQGETFATVIRRIISIGLRVWKLTRNPNTNLILEETVVDGDTGEKYIRRTIVLIP